METKIIQDSGKNKIAQLDDYQKGNAFVDELVRDHRAKISELILKYKNKDLSMASSSFLKAEVKSLLKEQNVGFVNDLSDYIVKNSSKKPNDISRSMGGDLKARLNSTGSDGAYWSLGGEKYEQAILWLVSNKNMTREVAENLLEEKGENAPELKDWNKGKEPFNWNTAMETTGKVAQSLFLLGGLFSKKEDPTPTISDSDNTTTKTTNNLARNIIITILVLGVIGTAAYFVFRTPKSK